MFIDDQVFESSHQLFLGTNVAHLLLTPTFVFVKSYFPSKFYNYFFLTKPPNYIDWSLLSATAQSMPGEESLYVTDDYYSKNQAFLEKLGVEKLGSGAYLYKTLSSKEHAKAPVGHELTTDITKSDYSSMLEECFTDFADSSLYNKTWEGYRESGQAGRVFETFIARNEGEVVGAGSVVVDKNLKLGYLHNGAVRVKHRRQGLHASLTNARINFANDLGAQQVFSVVEDGGSSYGSLTKLGFKARAKYYWLSMPSSTPN